MNRSLALALAVLVLGSGCSKSGDSRSGSTAPAISLAAFSSAPSAQASTAYLGALKATDEIDASVRFAPTYGIEIERAIAKDIAQAKKSLRIAQFVFTSPTLSYAVRQAHARGVQVRILLDGAYTKLKLAEDDAMAKEGISIKRIATSGSVMGKKFHHKFCVIDDDTVLTGSLNWTETADMYNYENSVTIHDAAIAKAFAREFDSLWTTGKGGVGTTDLVAFAPSGYANACQNRVADAIDGATTEIVAAIYGFTSDIVERALQKAIARGVHVTMLVDAREETYYQDKVQRLRKAGADIRRVVLPGSGAFAAKFHHKFAVIDAKWVVTGSFNWTKQQDQVGYDNVVVLKSKDLAKDFVQQFIAVWNSKVAKY